jgi:HEAT repeat protein
MTTEAQIPTFDSFEGWLRRSLCDADDSLRSEIAERILAHGADAVVPLIQILEERSLLDASTESEGGWAPIHAAVLLGLLRASEAIPALLAALADESYRDLLAEEVVESLTAIGSVALEPVLRAHAESSDPYHLMDLESILCSLGVQDERILTTLLGALERMPEYGACCLALYGDERAIEPLRQAFDRYLDSDLGSGCIDAVGEIRAAIRRLGGSLSEEQEQSYLRVSERFRAHAWPRSTRDGAAAQSKQKRRAARKQQKVSRKKNRRGR